MIRTLGLLAAIAGTAGCALTSKADAYQSRYFVIDPPLGRTANAARSASPFPLRLGHIESGGHIRDKLVYRDASGEVAFYDELRWTERPDAYLRRSLLHGLFQDGGLMQIVSADAPVLDVELLAFEEVRGSKPIVRVAIAVALHDDHAVLWQETVATETALPAVQGTARANAIVTALAASLQTVVRRITEKVTAELAKRPAQGT